MRPDTPLWMMAGAAAWNLLARLLREQTTFKRRSIDEVADLLRKPDQQLIRELLDAGEDHRIRFPGLGRGDRRREQRARLDKLREQYCRFHHNSIIVYQWADTEWYDMVHHRLKEEYGPELRAKIHELRRAALEFRTAMRLVLARIWFLSIIHFDTIRLLPIPSVAALARNGSTDILRTYQRVREAAVVLAGVYGDAGEYADEIGGLM
jgi:hypothetical protein